MIDERGSNRVVYGNSGISSVTLDAHTVLEIGSITKVMTALLLTGMAARGEVALDEPIARFLPPSVTLHERGAAIALLNLAPIAPACPSYLATFLPTGGLTPILSLITQSISSITFSQAVCLATPREPNSNIPVSVLDCSALRLHGGPRKATRIS
jgi:hypothetical protein